MSRVLAGPFLHTIWRPKVTGAEHVPASGGAILAANHQSVVDSVFLPLMMDRPVTFSAKSEYFTASGPAARLWAWYLKATNQLANGNQVLIGSWNLARPGEPPVSIEVRPSKTPHPFSKGFFRKLKCPAAVAQGSAAPVAGGPR